MIYPIRHLPQVIPIGVQTESGVEEVGFDVKAWLDEFDSLDLTVWPTRPGEDAAYPAADVEMVGTILYWHPNGADTAIEGMGKVEVLGLSGDRRKLSGWCGTMVRATSLADTQDPPEAARPWADEVLAAAEEAKRQADRAQDIADNLSGGAITGAVRFDIEQDLTEEQKAQARANISVDTGVSPIVEMQETAEGVDITITDAEGVKTATVKHGLKGEQGERGEKGEPGYTPVKGVDYFDGQPGKDGEPGKDGYTPIKGTDYWTEEDKQNIVDEVLAELPEGGVGVDVTEETNTYTQLLNDLERTVEELPEAGVQFETDETLTLENGILSVNTADAAAEADIRPITAQGVYNEFAVINALLKTI